MKQTCLLGLMIVAGVARGSFDLILLPGNDGRTYRYDPNNNVHLGSYGTLPNTSLITADSRGRSYSVGSVAASVQIMNYSTGVQVGQISTTGLSRSIELVGDSVFHLGNSTTLRSMNISTGGISIATLPSGIFWSSLAHFGDNLYVIGTSTSNQIAVQAVSLSSLTLGSFFNTAFTATAGSVIGKAAAVQNSLTNSQLLTYCYESATGVTSYGRVFLTPTGGFVSASTGLVTTGFSNAGSLPAMLAGHGGVWMVGQDGTVATSARVQRFELSGSSLLAGASTTFAAPGGFSNQAFVQPGIVIAPEPAAFMPLGLGLLLLRRKRK